MNCRIQGVKPVSAVDKDGVETSCTVFQPKLHKLLRNSFASSVSQSVCVQWFLVSVAHAHTKQSHGYSIETADSHTIYTPSEFM